MSDDGRCVRCGHAAEFHDSDLGYCVMMMYSTCRSDDLECCRCLAFVSEADELESALASGEEIEPLDFDGDSR